MLVRRRWGILWKCKLIWIYSTTTIIMTCVCLHNLCVDEWLMNNPQSEEFPIITGTIN